MRGDRAAREFGYTGILNLLYRFITQGARRG